MRYQAFRLVAAMAVLGVLGSGAAAYLVTSAGEEEVIPQGEVSAPSGSSAMPTPACTFAKDNPCNPDAGLSDAERDALYQRLRSEGDRLHREWLATLDIDAIDLHSLPRSEMPAFYFAGESTLFQAVAKADLIVEGTISQIRPTSFSGIDTVLNVDQTLKGSAQSTLVITQAGHLQPTQDRSGVEVVEAANAEILLPGDRAILLLQKTEPAGEASGEYYIQSCSGWYQIDNGKVRANALSTFGASIDGKAEGEFAELVKTAVVESAALQP